MSKIREDLNPGGYLFARISPGGTSILPGRHPQHKGGVTLIKAPVENVGNSCPYVKGKIQMRDP